MLNINRGAFQGSSIEQTTDGSNVRVSVYKSIQNEISKEADVVTADSITAEIAVSQKIIDREEAKIAFKQDEISQLK